MNEKKLFLIDAYSLIYRSYYAFINNPMFNSKGFNTSTIFGFLMFIDELLKNQKPTHIAVAFDSGKPTFRHEIYPQYKSNRLVTPEEIRKSVPIIKEILTQMNVNIVEFNGYEADDIIGTMAKQAVEKDFIVFMVTPDKDYYQLVDKKIFIYKPKKSDNGPEILGINEVKGKFGIDYPEQVIDILALWGDSSDNIPGVPGIGEKTAKKLISDYKSIENLLENVDKLNPKLKTVLSENENILLLSKRLVTIDKSVPLDFNEDQLKIKNFNEEKIKEIFIDLNFKSLINRFFKTTSVDTSQDINYKQGNLFEQTIGKAITNENKKYDNLYSIKHNYLALVNNSEIKDLANKLEKLKKFCFDTETTGLDPHNDFLVGISIAYNKNEAFYIPLLDEYDKSKIKLSILKQVFENPEISKIGHNLKFDILFLKRYDINVSGDLFDTMLAHYLLQPEQSHKMDILAEKYLNYQPVPIEDLIGPKGSTQLNMKSISIDKITEYACEDADITFQLKEVFKNEINKNGFNDLFYNIESKLLKVLIEIELNGFTINTDYLKYYSIKLKEDIENLENDIYNLAGEQFNIASPKQLGKILFEKLKISADAKLTKTKQYSTSEEELIKLANKHLIINKIIEHRGLTKLLNTYVEALPKLVNKNTGKIHTSFNQSMAVTGRLSSNNPNLQNIPIREERGREIRIAFIPSSTNNVILSADYSQIELRLMAHISKDENMIKAFIENTDIHVSTASKIFKIPIKLVTREQRSKAKTANFGIIYGISAFGLSQRLNIPKKEASSLIDEYFSTFPGIKKYMINTIYFAKEHGYVETIMKRKRHINEINSQNAIVRGMAERNAINTPIQGSAADIIKLAMIKISDEFQNKKLLSKMILQVHDELVFDVNKSELEEVKQIIKFSMENIIKLAVPLIVDIGIGDNWLEAH